MKKRNRVRRSSAKATRGNLFDHLTTSRKRARKAWTFERLEDRNVFAAMSLADLGLLSSLSSNNAAELQQILANEAAWWEQSASALSGNAGLSTSGTNYSTRAFPSDPYQQYQWHLINTGQEVGNPNYQTIYAKPGEDINVAGAWNLGYTGAGVSVAVVDSGVQTDHPDLAANISPLQFDAILGDDDGSPANTNNPALAHGTAVAGLIAAVGNNNIGTTGVAYNAQIVPIRLVDAGISDAAITAAIRFGWDTIDIYNHSWGPSDDVRTVDGPSAESLLAIRDSVFGQGSARDGLGAIHVWAAGNGGGRVGPIGFPGVGVLDSASYDGYVNSRYTIGVGGVDHDGSYNTIDGSVTQYMEAGPAILVAAPTGSVFIPIGNDDGTGSGIWTTDFVGDDGLNQSPIDGVEIDQDPFLDPDYTSRFNGTSASAPIVSGVIALMLEANPLLTWRDVQEILVRSARQVDQFENPAIGGGAQESINSWIVNASPLFQNPDLVPSIPVVDPYIPFPDVYLPGTHVSFSGNVGGLGTDQFVFYEDYQPLSPWLFTNGAGYTVSHGRGSYGEEYGYGHGLVDAELAVKLARQWHSQGQNLPDERTFTTNFLVLGGLEVHAGQQGNQDSGRIFVPGGIGGTGDDPFIGYWNEYFADNDPADPDDGPFVDYDGPSAYNRGGFFHYEIPDSNAMNVEWVEVKVSIDGPANSFDGLRLQLVSPNGTVSELNAYQQLNAGGSSLQSVHMPVLTDPPGTIVPDDAGSLVWTFSTNRNWGERYDAQLVLDPMTNLPLLDDLGNAVRQGWQVHMENWSTSDLPLNGIEVIWHGSPIEPETQRIQGFVGLDAGQDNDGDGVVEGDKDGDFNFKRYIQSGGDLDGDGSVGYFEFLREIDLEQESFLENVTVVATRVSDGVEVGRFVTGADGNYYFDLAPDEYIISIDPSSLTGDQSLLDEQGVASDRLRHFQSEWHITPDWFYAANTDAADLNDIRVILDGSGVPEKFLDPNLSLPVESGVRNLNFLVDPGTQPANEIVVQGLVYVDVDGDGVFNNDDAAGTGFIVYLDTNGSGQYEASDQFIETHEVMTDAQGNQYNYTLTINTGVVDRFLMGAVPPNAFWTATSPDTGQATIFGGPGDVFLNTDFGFEPPDGTEEPPPVFPGAITGVVFEDQNGDGVRQAGEDGVSGFRVYVDLDSDGQWDANEDSAITNVNGAYFISDLDPGSYRVGVVVASPWAQTSPIGGFRLVNIASAQTVSGVLFGIENLATRDFGDLPDSYKTSLDQDGPRHEISPGFRLGARVDGEVDGQPTSDALGDDSIFNDEDGVVLLGAVTNPTGVLVGGVTNSLSVTVLGVGGYLNAWMDFNRDGDFDDAGEHVPLSDSGIGNAQIDLDINPGTHTLRFAVPANLAAGPIAARFRWGASGLDYFGPANIGEVEDYFFANINPAPLQSAVPGDYDGSGMVDQGDYLIWRDSFGSTVNLVADGNGNGVVDAADYSVWRDHLGLQSTAGGGSTSGVADDSTDSPTLDVESLLARRYPSVSPEVAAVLESLGYVKVTRQIGNIGTQTLYVLPSSLAATSLANDESNAGAGGGSVATDDETSETASGTAAADTLVDWSSLQYSSLLGHTIGDVVVDSEGSSTEESVDMALLLLATQDIRRSSSSADDDNCATDAEWLLSASDPSDEVDMAFAAAFEDELDWRQSL